MTVAGRRWMVRVISRRMWRVEGSMVDWRWECSCSSGSPGGLLTPNTLLVTHHFQEF